MRSRYSAYALGDAAYISRSWHPGYRPAEVAPDPDLRWLGLDIIARSDDPATVEFEARYLRQGRVDAIHEISRFVCEQGQWLYTDGEQRPPTFKPWKPGRNEDCPCGSGRKFKRCCGA